MKKWLPVALLLVVVIWSHENFLKSGLPFTHDSQNHLARMANYYQAFKEGQLPPRWAPGLNNGFGYPVFNFNYPLPNILATPMIGMDIGVENSFKLITMIALFLGVTGMYQLLKNRFDTLGSMIGALLYLLTPYQASLVYVRGVIGETLVFAIFPWVMYLMTKLAKRPKNWRYFVSLVLVSSAYLLAHNILVFITSPLLVGYGVYLGWKKKQVFLRLLAAGILAVMLSSFFWIPALAEKAMTNLDAVSLSSQFSHHFPTLSQLLTGVFNWGFSYVGPVDGMSFAIGVVPLLVMLLGFVVLALKKLPPKMFLVWLIALLFVWMQLTASRNIWDLIPMSNYIQFPWRLTFGVTFLVPILAAWLVSQKLLPQWLWILLIGMLLVTAKGRQVNDNRFGYEDEYWLTFSQTTSILDENMPVWFKKHEAYPLKDEWFASSPVYIEGGAEVTLEHKTGTEKLYEIEAMESITVYENTAYFPGWQVEANGEKVKLLYDNEENPGLISYRLDPGKYEVKSRFSQKTTPRVWGNSLTIIAMMIVGGLLFYDYYQRKQAAA